MVFSLKALEVIRVGLNFVKNVTFLLGLTKYDVINLRSETL